MRLLVKNSLAGYASLVSDVRVKACKAIARKVVSSGAIAISAMSVVGCSVSDLVDVGKPGDDVVEEGAVKTYQGAVAMYNGAVSRFQLGFSTFATSTALFTDEMSLSFHVSTGYGAIDSRAIGADSASNITLSFTQLQRARGQAQQARGALNLHKEVAPSFYFARMYAIEGFAEVLMAELMCSGIPLTNSRFGEDIEFVSPLTTTETFESAIKLFDSALSITHDNDAVLTLAKIGKARALVNLARYDEAAAIANEIQTSSRYMAEYTSNEFYSTGQSYSYIVRSREGINGLDWDRADARTQFGTDGRQTKYAITSPVVVASGIEARLIEAEAALQNDDPDSWASILNSLRSSAITPAIPPLSVDSTTGANKATQISVHFRERAFWLFLTGHRQGDLRRLVRNYNRNQNVVYPTGSVLPVNNNYPFYGAMTNVSPPMAEERNPLFQGCFNRNS